MFCFVCTEKSDQTFAIFGEENSKIATIIEKHLYIKPPVNEPQETLKICKQCWVKLRDFNEFYEFVAKLHNEESKCFQGQPLEDSGGEQGDKTIWTSNIETEALEETDEKVQLHFFETEDCFTENPLLELASEEHELEDFVDIDVTVKDGKTKNTKTKKAKKVTKKPRTSVSSESEDNRQSLASLLEDELNDLSEKKKKPKRKVNLRPNKKADTSNDPKRRKCHVLLEENDGLIKKHIQMICQACSYVGEDFSNLIKHYKEFHKTVKPYIKCCKRILYYPTDILQHAYFHEDPEHFKCQECGKTFINNSGLKNHIRNHHEPEETLRYGCDQCPRRFSMINLLAHHKAKHVPETERSHFCEICVPPKAFANDYILQTHIKSRHTKASNICHVCAKEIRDKQAFEKHVRLHFEASGPRVKCPRENCDVWLKDKDNLKNHLRRFHNQAIYKCPECERICKNKQTLTSHFRYMHSKQTFTCEECQKTFKSAISLKEHTAGHTGEPLYSCPFCTRTFNSNANMYSHRKKAHPVEWDLVNKSKMGFI